MKGLLGLALLVSLASATWIGEEYWTSIDSSGRPLQGSIADFARLDGFEDRFVAFWITRKYYLGEHFEAFGQAYLNSDGRVCATFAGFRRENIEICGEFRVLSVPPRHAGRSIFEWVDAHYTGASNETVGYLAHRIAKATNDDGEIIYGDAIPSKYTFSGAQRTRTDVEHFEQQDYVQRVQLLRLKVEENIYRQPVLPRIPAPPPPVAPIRTVAIMCDEFGGIFQQRFLANGGHTWEPFDVQSNGGRRPDCTFTARAFQLPVQPPPRNDRYAHALLPDHHDANGEVIGDSQIGQARRFRRKTLRGGRSQSALYA